MSRPLDLVLIHPVPGLYFTDSTRLAAYLTRYHLGSGRMVTVTPIPEHPIQTGMVSLSGSSSIYQLTIYEGTIAGRLRRAIRILEVNRELYYSLMSSTGAESEVYLDRLDDLVDAWTARMRKLRALAEIATASSL